MVIDSSAIIAVLLKESDGPAFSAVIRSATERVLSTVSYLEIRMVLAGRLGVGSGPIVADFVRNAKIEIAAFDLDQAERASAAFLRYGKGRGHSAGLNFGDCAVYGLAMGRGLPLLFKGDDFRSTDVKSVL